MANGYGKFSLHISMHYIKNTMEMLEYAQTVDTMCSSPIFWAPGNDLANDESKLHNSVTLVAISHTGCTAYVSTHCIFVTLVATSHTGCTAYVSTHCTLWPWWLHHTLAVQPTYPHTAPWVCPPRHTQLWRSRTQHPVRGHQPHLWNQSHWEL